jgi:hypothetical protein
MLSPSRSTITAAMLQKFCGDDSSRPMFRRPFSQGAFSYATNGALIVRVDRLAEVAELDSAPHVERFFKLAFNTGRLKFGPMPAIAAEGSEPVVIGAGSFQPALLRLVAVLPGVVVAPGEDDLSPCRIRFDGGSALCMPLRTK